MLGENPARVDVPGSRVGGVRDGREGEQDRLKAGVLREQFESSSSGGHQEKVTCLSPASAENSQVSHTDREILFLDKASLF